MKVTPVLFTAPMVRALLDGSKSQTRRVAKQPTMGRNITQWPNKLGFSLSWGEWQLGDPEIVCPYGQPGDLLWCKEAHQYVVPQDGPWKRQVIPSNRVKKALAGDGVHVLYGADCHSDVPMRSPRFMHRWASRLTLRLTDVRAQRVQEISEADAKAEGVVRAYEDPNYTESSADNSDGYFDPSSYGAGFEQLWDSLNAKRGHGWDTNPWVWALTFEVIQANVDTAPGEHTA